MRGYSFSTITIFRVAHAVFLSITITSFVFVGWRARLFLISINITSFVFSGRVRVYFLVTTTIARFVFSSGGVCGYF